MTNPIYQATVIELEALLSPRIVSRTLREGLRQLGRSAEDVQYEELEKILKQKFYHQLQVTMPVTEAKQKIVTILSRLKEEEAGAQRGGTAQTPSQELENEALSAQRATLDDLDSSLKPFNLYFEWPEVQKLRAQIQLLRDEQEAGNEAPQLVREARNQLKIVEEKLEDHLVIQARELADLEATLEEVRDSGIPKVKRLENLINHVRSAQENRQLVAAEMERARKIGRELRKLVETSSHTDEGELEQQGLGSESSLMTAEEAQGASGSAEASETNSEVNARLRLLDIENERRDLDVLEQEHANLLTLLPDLKGKLEELRNNLDQDVSISSTLEALTEELQSASEEQQTALIDELTQIGENIKTLPESIDTGELQQVLQVAQGILSTTLPSQSDVQHIRHLHRLTKEYADALERQQVEAENSRAASLEEQAEVLSRLQSTLLRYQDTDLASNEYVALADHVTALKDAQQRQEIAATLVSNLRLAEEKFEAAIAQRSDDQNERTRAQVRSLLAQLANLPVMDELANRLTIVKRDLEDTLTTTDDSSIDAAQLQRVGDEVQSLKRETSSVVRNRLSLLAGSAAESGDKELLPQIQQAAENLEQGVYPDLKDLEAQFHRAKDFKRAEQVAELHQLEREANQLSGVDTEANAKLNGLLASISAAIDRGELARDLDEAWLLLESLRTAAKERLVNFEPRLDSALESFKSVEKLNSDEVETARRILHHLDSQRTALDRISTKLKVQLADSLTEAEALIAKLNEHLEATRAIADRLVSDNVIDDVLGLFAPNDPPEETLEIAGEQDGTSKDGAVTDSPTLHSPLTTLVESYLAEEGVRDAAIITTQGKVIAGRFNHPLERFQPTIEAYEDELSRLGGELSMGALKLLTLETPTYSLVAAWPTPEHKLLIFLDVPSMLNTVLSKTRRDLGPVATQLGGTAVT
jgi:hypothetical protein